jgi:hypothetical protein
MNNPLQNLRTEAYKVSLTNEERGAMHARLMARVGERAQAAAPTRLQPGLYYFFSPQLSMSLAALMVILLVGSGTAYAAEGSLPGDALYVIKTKVTEPIVGALAISTEDKIKFHTAVTETRIKEAEVLASQNRLDTGATQELESSIDAHISERDALAQKLNDQNQYEEAGSAAIARLDTSITAHSDILAQLGEESSSSTTKQNSGTLAMRVRSGHSSSSGAQPTIMMAKVAATSAPQEKNTIQPEAVTLMVAQDASTSLGSTSVESAPSSSSSANSNRDARQDKKSRSSKIAMFAASLGKKATSTLESLRAQTAAMKDKINSDTKEKLDSRFNKINSFIRDGNEAMKDGDYQDAIDSFDEALDRETTLSAFISAGVQFDRGILGNLLGNDSRWGDDR